MSDEAKQTQFTPGPWMIVDGIDGVARIESERGEWSICETAGACSANGLPGEDESDANARLIAAAPALYDVINKLLDAMDMQEGREREQLHISQHEAWHVWTNAKLHARAALALVDSGPVTEGETR